MPAADQYNRQLAESINQMFSQGTTDPRAEEIAQFHFGGKAVGGEVLDGIRKRLPTISKIIQQDYEHLACIVSEKYYTLFRNRQGEMFEMTDTDARKCLPLGGKSRSEGIRLCTETNDVIYQAAVAQGLAMGTGLIEAGVGRARKAAERGHIPEERGVRIAESLKQRLSVVPGVEEMRQLAHESTTQKRSNRKK